MLFQFRVPFLTWNDLLCHRSGHHWKVLFIAMYKVEFPKAYEWHWKPSLCNRGILRLAVTYQVTQAFWLCKQNSEEVSWHCTFKSSTNLPPQHLMHLSVLPRVIRSTINSVPQWTCLQCIPFITASSQSNKKCPLRPYFQSLYLKVFLNLVVCPLVYLESVSTPSGLRSLWTLSSESKCLGSARNIIKLVRWKLWAAFEEKHKVYWSHASLHVLLGLMQTDRR